MSAINTAPDHPLPAVCTKPKVKPFVSKLMKSCFILRARWHVHSFRRLTLFFWKAAVYHRSCYSFFHLPHSHFNNYSSI